MKECTRTLAPLQHESQDALLCAACMKLYVHWEGDQPFTKVLKLDDHRTVSYLREACWSALNERLLGLSASSSASLLLYGADCRTLPLTSRLADVASNADDIFLRLLTAEHPQVPLKPSDATSCLNKQDKNPIHENSNPAAVATQPPGAAPLLDNCSDQPLTKQSPAMMAPLPKAIAATTSGPVCQQQQSSSQESQLLPLVHALWQRAEAAAARQNYRLANEALQQALMLVAEPSSEAHIATLIRLARLWLGAGQPGVAVRWALAAAGTRPEDPEVLELAGDCLREGGQPREAAVHYQSTLDVLQQAEERATSADIPSTSTSSSDPSPTPTQLRLRLSLAACLHALPGVAITPPYDNQDLAAALVMAVLERDPGHWEALRLYGTIAYDRGLREDALRVALRLVVGQPEHRGARGLLASCLTDDEGVRLLFEELGVPPAVGAAAAGSEGPAGDWELQPPAAAGAAEQAGSGLGGHGSGAGGGGGGGGGEGIAAALGFVATSIKDHGKVDSCISLLATAARLAPRNASYALNLVHALELRQALVEALEAGGRYCRVAGQLGGMALGDVDALLGPLPTLECPVGLTWYTAAPAPEWSSPWRLLGPGEQADGWREGAGGGDSGKAPKVSYTSDQLDELALLFTLVKVLFVGGALGAAAALCGRVEPLRRASSVELHTTLIRNEAAYFGCVLQLLKDHPPPPPPPQPRCVQPPPTAPVGNGTCESQGCSAEGGDAAATAGSGTTGLGAGDEHEAASYPEPLYLCGDSHCLSAAWRHVTLRGRLRLLRPLLITGCKVWHLRPDSEFYPKKQFEATLRLLPDGSQVVLVLGEIDCREGLLLAVQKGKYDTVAEGISATVAIYLAVLRRLVSERQLEIFLHPPPPVLNETRHIVAPFTAALRASVAAARAADPALAARLHWLDFFDQLLVPQGRPTGTADGATHPAGNGDASNKRAATTASAVSSAGGAATNGGSGERLEAGDGAGEGGGHEGRGRAWDTGAGLRALKLDGGGASSAEGEGAAAADGEMGALRPDLTFDGTHLSPVYLPLLDAALRAVR